MNMTITNGMIESRVEHLCNKQAEAWASMLFLDDVATGLMDTVGPHDKSTNAAVQEYHKHRREYERITIILSNYPKELVAKYIV